MTRLERVLEPNSTETPECICGRDMVLVSARAHPIANRAVERANTRASVDIVCILQFGWTNLAGRRDAQPSAEAETPRLNDHFRCVTGGPFDKLARGIAEHKTTVTHVEKFKADIVGFVARPPFVCIEHDDAHWSVKLTLAIILIIVCLLA